MADDSKSRDPAAEELEEVHAYADPAMGSKVVDGGDRANATAVDQGAGVAEADKKL